MSRSLVVLVAAVVVAVVAASVARPLMAAGADAKQPMREAGVGLPRDGALPVPIDATVNVLAVLAIDDPGAFLVEFELRLAWADSRLVFSVSEVGSDLQVYDGADADEQTAKMWVPPIRFANQIGDLEHDRRGLCVYSTGRVEWIRRIKGKFASPFKMSRFPFDTQELPIVMEVEKYSDSRVVLSYATHGLQRSSLNTTEGPGNWSLLRIELESSTVTGWAHSEMSVLTATVIAGRNPKNYIAPILVPLLAIMAFPILALWIKASVMEKANLILTGFLSLIALNFTVDVGFPGVCSSDNSVTRLFWIAYLLIAVAMMMVITIVNADLGDRLFGEHIRAELESALRLALPVVVGTLAACTILSSLT